MHREQEDREMTQGRAARGAYDAGQDARGDQGAEVARRPPTAPEHDPAPGSDHQQTGDRERGQGP